MTEDKAKEVDGTGCVLIFFLFMLFAYLGVKQLLIIYVTSCVN